MRVRATNMMHERKLLPPVTRSWNSNMPADGARDRRGSGERHQNGREHSELIVEVARLGDVARLEGDLHM